jgi:uncharacterized protein (TIGR02678 family)
VRGGLGDALEATRVAERQRAARALLRRPLLRASGPRAEAFSLVRRHEAALREWFDRNTGWRLEVGPEVARLLKTPADPADATHPLRDARTERRPFSRRRYVLLALCLAALDRADTQVTLGRLAEQVVLLAADPELTATGLAFRLEHRDERVDLVAAVRTLLDLGVLVRVAGTEDSFVSADGDALYDVDRRVLALLLVSRQGPSAVASTDPGERLAALADAAPARGTALSEEARVRALRHRLTRLLLELPVVHDDDLTDEERAYLVNQRANLAERIGELTGLVAEVRAEGMAMVDPEDSLTDVGMPETGTDGHVTLLLAEHLAARDRADPGAEVPQDELFGVVRALAQQHRTHWRSDTRAPGAEVALVEQTLDRLEALRLVRRNGPPADAVQARPALHRYAVDAPVVAGGP